jgi:hypothetical protein
VKDNTPGPSRRQGPAVASLILSLGALLSLSAIAACSDGAQRSSTPTAPSVIAGDRGGEASSTSRVEGIADAAGPDGGLPGSRNVTDAVEFPPRDGTLTFRQQLETAYRDQLRRSPTTSFVDIEGTIVWTQEYLRYRVNGCGHQDAITRVTAQIQGRGIQPICVDFTGTTVNFPPRNEPFAFRQELERIYRDELRRSAVQTFVDAEGDIVWTQEYLRYRLNGCGQTDATDRVLTQVSGGPVQPTCTGSTPTPPITNFVTTVTAPGATTTLVNSPRPNAGAGPIITPSGGGGLITLTASQPVDRIIVSVNTTGPSTTRLGSLAVVGSYFELRLSTPRNVIQVTIQGSGAFNLEFAASLGGGPLGPYQPVPFNAPATAALQIVFSPSPVPWAGTGACGSLDTNVWRYMTTFTETGGVGVTLTAATFVQDGVARPESAANIVIPARGVTVSNASCQAVTSAGQHVTRVIYRGTDANGRAVSFVSPDLILLARP